MNINEVRDYFINELKSERFTVDKTGTKTIEMIGASFLADKSTIFGEVNQDYVDAEIQWYMKESTNIKDIYGDEKEPPAAWKYTANDAGEINSNYGHLIFSPRYYEQYNQVVNALVESSNTRRATMIYNRPSMHYDWFDQGKNDFVCTNAVTYYIRDNKLHAVVQMRSNDVIFGYKNDYAWQKYVLGIIIEDYNYLTFKDNVDEKISPGNIYWQVQNLHVYERHFELVK